MKKNLLKTMLVGVMMLATTSVCAQTTWQFQGNTEVWGAEGITLSGGNQYNENASPVTVGGLTFTGTEGFVATAKGIGFKAVGSTEDENISIVVPSGYKAVVSIMTSSNRTVVGSFGETSQTFNVSWDSSTKEFDNSNGSSDITLYLYCNLNPGGADQKKAPFLEKIVLIDMNSVTLSDYTIYGAGQEVASGQYVEGQSYIAGGIPEVIESNGSFYVLNDERIVNHKGTFTEGSVTLEYIEDSEIIFFSEGEDLSPVIAATNNESFSRGKGSAVQGQKRAEIGIFAPGHYRIVVSMCDNPNRGVYFRNLAEPISTENVILNLGEKNGPLYVEGEFDLQAETKIGISGYTTTKETDAGTTYNTNQSATIDYLIIYSTGGGITTAIQGVKNLEIANDAIFNLAGQEVKNATKGIFIKNGKKVVK